MIVRARGLVTAAVVAAILGASACASAGSGSRDPGASQAPAAVHCPTTPVMPGRTNESIPAGFKTAWVLRCRDDERAVPGDGTWHFRIEERADTKAAALVVALRKPDKKTPSGTVCPGIATSLGYFALVDESGKAIYPRVPIGFCYQPQDAVVEALKALPFHEVKATPLNQEQSQRSIDTGCGQMWTDGVTDEKVAHSKPASARRMWGKTPDAVRICLWQLRSTGYPQLVSADIVTGADLAALLATLDDLPAARPCTAKHGRFAVVEYIRKQWFDSAAYAETDGCQVIVRPDHTLGQLDDATARLLTTLSHP